jgi:hypothetical protein
MNEVKIKIVCPKLCQGLVQDGFNILWRMKIVPELLSSQWVYFVGK